MFRSKRMLYLLPVVLLSALLAYYQLLPPLSPDGAQATGIAHNGDTTASAVIAATDTLASPDTLPAASTPVPSPGASYYVDPGGSDSNDGSEANPWQTIQHAVDSVVPGDTIVVQAGTYEGARVEGSGTADAWIRLRAAPGAEVLINQPGTNNAHDSNLEFETWEGDGVVAYWVVEGFEVAGAPNWGIDIRGNDTGHAHHFILRGNVVHDNGVESEKSGIFTAFVDDVVVEANESHANGEHGIYLSNSGDRFTVRGNRLHGNAFCGLHMNGDASQGGDGMISDGVVEANTIYGNGAQGCSAINMDGVSRTTVRNNLLYQNHAGGISLFQRNGAECSRDNRVLNNTIVMPEDGRWAINLSHITCVNNKIFNNIIYTFHPWRGSILIPAPDITGFESDHNVVIDRFSADDDNSVISLAKWQAYGYDEQSIIAAPSELFAGPDDYHLRPGSPAIDAGLALPDVTADLDGNPRPSGEAIDIGALEFTGEPAGQPPSPAGGTITYSVGERVYRLAAREGATPEDITAALDDLSTGGGDAGLNISPDGEWLVLETERFDPDCAGWACLAVVTADLSSGEVVRVDGEPVRVNGFSAVGSGGSPIVYPAGDGPHDLDLWAIFREDNGWTAPLLLTADSPYSWNDRPAISADGRSVVFDCGNEPYAAEGTSICEVGTDGSNFQAVLTPADSPAGFPDSGALHHPDYAPDGGILFEADWDGEQIWRLPPDATVPTRISTDFNNDNSPCVLPDGRIVSLWLDRPDGQGTHEIKVMAPDGSRSFMALTGEDVVDGGIGCGGDAGWSVIALPVALSGATR